jgi:hypothetical protein
MGVSVIEGGWRYAAASVIGTSHQTSPEGICQDSHGFQFLDTVGAFVGVVSDGAGSASQSKVGSRLTCDFILKRIAETPDSLLFSNSLAADVLERLRVELQRVADDAGLTMRDFACTMLVAIVTPERAAFWQIGDGAICFRAHDQDRFSYVFWPEKGDYANVTFFVTDQSAQTHLEFDVADTDIADLAIFSDGLERLALDFVSGEAHTAFFNGLFPPVRSLVNPGCSAELSAQISGFLGSERVNKRTDDDKTLLLASYAK